MLKSVALRLLSFGLFAVASSQLSQAALITHEPDDAIPPIVVSPPFGGVVPGGVVGTSLIDMGVDYSFGNAEGIFDDGGGVLAFSGLDGGGILSLLDPVDGRIVLPTTLTQGLTSFLFAEAGFAADGTLLLEAFDIGGALLASTLNGPPVGPNGRTTFTIDRLGVYDIASFRISGGDSFGVNRISIEAPVGAAPAVPEPASMLLLGLGGLGVFTGSIRRRLKQSV